MKTETITETLHCENGQHDWIREGIFRGRKPVNCGDHATVKAENSVGVPQDLICRNGGGHAFVWVREPGQRGKAPASCANHPNAPVVAREVIVAREGVVKPEFVTVHCEAGNHDYERSTGIRGRVPASCEEHKTAKAESMMGIEQTLTCVTCENPFTWTRTGRGAAAKYCPSCKGVKSASVGMTPVELTAEEAEARTLSLLEADLTGSARAAELFDRMSALLLKDARRRELHRNAVLSILAEVPSVMEEHAVDVRDRLIDENNVAFANVVASTSDDPESEIEHDDAPTAPTAVERRINAEALQNKLMAMAN